MHSILSIYLQEASFPREGPCEIQRYCRWQDEIPQILEKSTKGVEEHPELPKIVLDSSRIKFYL